MLTNYSRSRIKEDEKVHAEGDEDESTQEESEGDFEVELDRYNVAVRTIS